MSEENKAVPTKEEIQKINEEIEKRETQTIDAVKRDVVASVKKEIQDEQQRKELEEKSAKLEKELEEAKKAQEEQINALKEEFKKELQNVKDMRLSVPENANPFKPGETVVSDNKAVNLQDPDVVHSIEEESRLKFIEENDLPASWGTR